MGNEILITQTISALLNNAVKFVPPGTHPQVKIWTEPKDDMVRWWVEDNGIGIEPQFFERIFDVFQTLNHQQAFAGIGVGLPLAKKAVERMDGSIGLESKVGQGARFWIELPRIIT